MPWLDADGGRRWFGSAKRSLKVYAAAAAVPALAEIIAGRGARAFCKCTLDCVRLGPELEPLGAAWMTGDADTLHASVLRETEDLPGSIAGELSARIYERRNETMANKVAAMLARRQVVFVAVGAGHLTGATGIPALLKERGLLVRRL